MKTSVYNLVVPCKKGFAVFNTLNGSILFVDEEMKTILQQGDFGKLKKEDIETLKRLGFLIDDDLDEKRVLSFRLKSLIYSPRKASFSVLPTYACNLACPYCYEGSGTINRGTMSEDMVNQVIQGIKAYCLGNGIQNMGLTLYGGEPLLHKKASLKLVLNLGKWAEEQGIIYKSNMITNGTLIDNDMFSEFYPFLEMVQLTLDGPQLSHDKKRIQKNGEGTYEKIMESIKIAREHDILVMLRIQVSKDTIKTMDELFQDLRERNIHKDEGIHTYVFPLMDINDVCSSYASLCSEEDAHILPTLWRTARKYGLEMVSKPIQVFLSPYCSFASNHSFLIDALGDVYKCVSVVGDTQFKAGHMSEKGLTGITPEWYAFTVRDPTDIDMCQDCQLLPLCGGGCAHRAYQKHGHYMGGYCVLHKGLEEEKLLLYLEKHYPDKFG